MLSVVLVFIEQMRFDEEIYEERQYLADILNLESKLYDVLCHINGLVSSVGGNIEQVTREVMQMQLRTLSDRSDRYIRDYVTTKDITYAVNKLLVQYVAISNHYSTR